jgi:hypothetical protein
MTSNAVKSRPVITPNSPAANVGSMMPSSRLSLKWLACLPSRRVGRQVVGNEAQGFRIRLVHIENKVVAGSISIELARTRERVIYPEPHCGTQCEATLEASSADVASAAIFVFTSTNDLPTLPLPALPRIPRRAW